jgi:hypothetical protein
MAEPNVSEALVAKPLPDMIEGLGLAVASANAALAKNAPKGGPMVYAIHTAEIELKIAISMETQTNTEVGGKVGFSVFSVNASYARRYNFKEEASSTIKLMLSAVMPQPATT